MIKRQKEKYKYFLLILSLGILTSIIFTSSWLWAQDDTNFYAGSKTGASILILDCDRSFDNGGSSNSFTVDGVEEITFEQEYSNLLKDLGYYNYEVYKQKINRSHDVIESPSTEFLRKFDVVICVAGVTSSYWHWLGDINDYLDSGGRVLLICPNKYFDWAFSFPEELITGYLGSHFGVDL